MPSTYKQPSSPLLLPEKPEQPRSAALQVEQDDLIVFADDGKFYLVPQKCYQATPLPESLWAMPEFVVGLGAVTADLKSFEKDGAPGGAMSGMLCVVVNLASLFNDREKRGRPNVTFGPREDGKPPRDAARPALRGDVDGRGPTIDQQDLVVFDQYGTFYWVKHKDYLEPPHGLVLPKSLSGAPSLMVELGTVLADIPLLPTVGCACVLLNLSALRLGSASAAKKLREQDAAGTGALAELAS